MTPKEQLELWVEGNSIHNKDNRDECCPDFSCCKPELKANRKIREAFANANGHDRGHMLMMFLGQLINNYFKEEKGKKVYITDGTRDEG